MSTPRTAARSPATRPLLWLSAGVALLVLYAALSAFEVGGIGQPTDIGGGLIPLVGLILIVTGLIKLVLALVRSRGSGR